MPALNVLVAGDLEVYLPAGWEGGTTGCHTVAGHGKLGRRMLGHGSRTLLTWYWVHEHPHHLFVGVGGA